MWIPAKTFQLFEISKETVAELREKVAALKAENETLKADSAAIKANADWFRVKINALEAERAALLEKLYHIKIPVPEIVRQPAISPLAFASDLFNDMGDDEAKKHGLPTFSN